MCAGKCRKTHTYHKSINKTLLNVIGVMRQWLRDNSCQQANVTTIKAFKEEMLQSAAEHLLCFYSVT